jgi:hypothetical protein
MKLMRGDYLRPLSTPGVLLALVISSSAQDIQIPLEAYKAAEVSAVAPTEVFFDVGQTLSGHFEFLSYLAFDLSVLPEGFAITGAKVNVFDMEADLGNPTDSIASIYLLDVPENWGTGSLTYTAAVAQFGAVVASDEVGPHAAVNNGVVRWSGSINLDNQDVVPGEASVGSRRDATSAAPHSDADLLAVLREDRVSGDGLVTMAIRGGVRDLGDPILGIDFPDSEKGPTLVLTLSKAVDPNAVITYDFDDGSLQGWQQVGTSTFAGGPTGLGVINESDPNVGNSVPPLPQSSPSFIGPLPFEASDGTNTRDQAHETLILRSPQFSMNPTGSISFSLIGGSQLNFFLDDINLNGLPSESTGGGAIGVALRRVSDGQYLTFNGRTESGSQFWEPITLGEAELGSLVSGDERYTLDFIDFHSGGWAWVGLDSVVISKGSAPEIEFVDTGNGEVVLAFEGELQMSTTLEDGSWEDVVGATSPYVVPTVDGKKFFRSILR